MIPTELPSPLLPMLRKELTLSKVLPWVPISGQESSSTFAQKALSHRPDLCGIHINMGSYVAECTSTSLNLAEGWDVCLC